MLKEPGYYITESKSLLIFYGDSFDHYTDKWENCIVDSNAIEFINAALEFEYIGEL